MLDGLGVVGLGLHMMLGLARTHHLVREGWTILETKQLHDVALRLNGRADVLLFNGEINKPSELVHFLQHVDGRVVDGLLHLCGVQFLNSLRILSFPFIGEAFPLFCL